MEISIAVDFITAFAAMRVFRGTTDPYYMGKGKQNTNQNKGKLLIEAKLLAKSQKQIQETDKQKNRTFFNAIQTFKVKKCNTNMN